MVRGSDRPRFSRTAVRSVSPVETKPQTVDYESPTIIEYGDFAAITEGSGHDPIDSGPHGGPHFDPHLTFSAG